ncbi:MAG: 1-(5-phosphoribosyl)-5-[(5-phosphoribosylamino)methylideneamino]imidazole-4-carboxamide isomerase [Ruminococcaceae bacterium]|nr:1-(5-phosphoribosyl)-5-[(5-phosphoribosylamino)methylideneamino]imidazole-4-carboxamide isomerase [Oscillospiraceae bacterium]
MNIFPAIDLYGGKAVRLLKGDYAQMTVYSDSPLSVAADFVSKGAKFIHLVDLEGARDGNTPNLDTVSEIVKNTSLFSEIGGGIRDMNTVEKYLSVGVDRVILGTAAVTDRAFLEKAVTTYGDKIAVGVDIRDGFVAIKGWTELSSLTLHEFCRELEALGVRTLICTDISRDGNMRGTNRELYREMSELYKMQIVASGGVSTLDDVRALAAFSLYGAIIGKAYYTGAIDLSEAIEVAK